ncbi:hypothetical protein NPIL_487981 [Nephila pilipes]|uniref:Uncharacterized protein n=1 Tax=Nephila pilipes TaxID=299642 RepID=A0A8X6QYB3_NEPPI|nr:hypothetical protein NPIL_487981 [Nephila pilipes]
MAKTGLWSLEKYSSVQIAAFLSPLVIANSIVEEMPLLWYGILVGSLRTSTFRSKVWVILKIKFPIAVGFLLLHDLCLAFKSPTARQMSLLLKICFVHLEWSCLVFGETVDCTYCNGFSFNFYYGEFNRASEEDSTMVRY